MSCRTVRCRAVVGLAAFASACGTPPPITPQTAASPATDSRGAADASTTGLIPAGFGALRQDSIAIKLQPSTGVLVWLIPLDESVIRVLAPDSYRTLHAIADSRQTEIARAAAGHGLRDRHVWYVIFFGLAPDARFDPYDITVTSAGRDFRPVDIIPLKRGFGEQRVQPRERQEALYLFDDAVDVTQPLAVTMGGQRSTSWENTLRSIDLERAAVRTRAATAKP
jgi:hypothetical protein